jgi:hypothetical protein
MRDNIVKFANGDTKVLDKYNGMRDYFFHYMSAVEGKKIGDFDASISLEEKEAKMHSVLLSEVERVSGSPKGDLSYEAWSMSPQVKWATFAVVGIMIDAVLPDTIIKTTGVYTDIVFGNFGDTCELEVQPNSIFQVSESGNSQRKGFNKKQYSITKSISAVNHQITVQTSLYRVLSGKESLARFVRKAIISMETTFNKDAYNYFRGVVNNANFPTPFKLTGFTMDDAITLAQRVEAYNNNQKVSFVGTKKAIYQMLPDASKGYRMVTDATNPQINIIRGIFDWDIIEIPQVATGDAQYGLALADDEVYVMSLGGDKPLKAFVEGDTLTNVGDFYDTANLTSSATLNKRWGVGMACNNVLGVIKV